MDQEFYLKVMRGPTCRVNIPNAHIRSPYGIFDEITGEGLTTADALANAFNKALNKLSNNGELFVDGQPLNKNLRRLFLQNLVEQISQTLPLRAGEEMRIDKGEPAFLASL